MIVDCHTHWGACWVTRSGDDPSEWLRTLDRHGVDRAFLCGHRGLIRPEHCAEDNDTVARVASQATDRLVPFATCWPQQGAEAVVEARRCLEELGMAGLKLHPWLQGFSTADPAMAEICEVAAASGAPIMFHDGTPCYCLSEQIGGLARRFPHTQFVLGHAGLLWNWRSALAAAQLPNVWVCLCGPHLRGIEILCERVDPDRLLWGTDYGFSLADTINYRLNLLRRARLDDSIRAKALGLNAQLLLSGSAP